MRNLWQADQGAAVNNALLFDPMSGCCVSFIAIGAGFAFRGASCRFANGNGRLTEAVGMPEEVLIIHTVHRFVTS
jgi:hypothetical protein